MLRSAPTNSVHQLKAKRMETPAEEGLDSIFGFDSSPPPSLPEVPRFPHHNLEASSLLGLPDSPTIHLAVTTVRDMLIALVEGLPHDERAARITAWRQASGAVLESLPIECAAMHFLSIVGLQFDQEAAELAYATKRTDWLSLAHEQIRASGLHPGPSVQRAATPYGWVFSRVDDAPDWSAGQ